MTKHKGADRSRRAEAVGKGLEKLTASLSFDYDIYGVAADINLPAGNQNRP